MEIEPTSVTVDDQAKMLNSYADALGFMKKTEFQAGEFKWLTLVSPEGPAGIEPALEPNANTATKTFQKALFQQGIPLTAFAVEDIQEEYERLKKLGVVFRTEPAKTGPVTIAVFDDTCGNLIQSDQE